MSSPTTPASLIIRPESYVQRLDLAGLYRQSNPLDVELGSGDGGFLAAWAEANPRRNFLGVERLLGRLRKLDRKGIRRGLSNLRLLRLEAGYFMNYLLGDACVSRLHVYFPDPWPKRKHLGNRLINAPFVETAWRVLVMGGEVFLRTDDHDYFSQMYTVFAGHPGFELIETPDALASVCTDFEREFNARGIPTLRAAYRKRAA